MAQVNAVRFEHRVKVRCVDDTPESLHLELPRVDENNLKKNLQPFHETIAPPPQVCDLDERENKFKGRERRPPAQVEPPRPFER